MNSFCLRYATYFIYFDTATKNTFALVHFDAKSDSLITVADLLKNKFFYDFSTLL